MQTEIIQPGSMLNTDGHLAQVGWSRQPLLDCNLEATHFYTIRSFQRFRCKRWDYYAVFSPKKFFSATIADLGYAGNLLVYVMDFETGDLHEEGLVIPFSKGVQLPRNSTEGVSHFEDGKVSLDFHSTSVQRKISVTWSEFHGRRGIQADISLTCPL